jgi:hypothetical protein
VATDARLPAGRGVLINPYSSAHPWQLIYGQIKFEVGSRKNLWISVANAGMCGIGNCNTGKENL